MGTEKRRIGRARFASVFLVLVFVTVALVGSRNASGGGPAFTSTTDFDAGTPRP